VRPILKMPIPSTRSSRMRASIDDLTGGRPSLVPRALAPRKACVDTLADHAALEFGEDAAHLKHGAAGKRASEERLLVQVR